MGGENALTSVPSDIGALTGLEKLGLNDNQLTGFPTEFRTWGGPSGTCYLFDNPGFSCANLGADSSCCTGEVFLGNGCGEGLPGGQTRMIIFVDSRFSSLIIVNEHTFC